MMLLRRKTALGLVLCTLVLSASVPLLLGIEATPNAVFGGDMVAISQVNTTESLSAALVENLKAQNDTLAASAEVTCFTVVRGEPVVVRGVELEDFLELENSTLVKGEVRHPERFVVVGRKLADRAGLDIGDRLLLTGSSSPALFYLEVDAVYRGRYSEDELLVPLPCARKMAGLGDDSVLFIRVRTTNQTALFQELENMGEKVVITNSAGTAKPVNVQISEEERLAQQYAIKYLDTARFKASNGSFVSMFVQEGTNSIRVVVTTFMILDCGLAFIGSAAIVSRAIIERRNELGIISAIGANKWQLRGMLLRDLLLISVTASLCGTLMGYLVVNWIEDTGLLLMFGETVHAVIDPYILLMLFLASVGIQVLSGLVLGSMLTKDRPRMLMQETDAMERYTGAPALESVLGVET